MLFIHLTSSTHTHRDGISHTTYIGPHPPCSDYASPVWGIDDMLHAGYKITSLLTPVLYIPLCHGIHLIKLPLQLPHWHGLIESYHISISTLHKSTSIRPTLLQDVLTPTDTSPEERRCWLHGYVLLSLLCLSGSPIRYYDLASA